MRLVNRFILFGLALFAALSSSAQYVQPMRYDHYSITQQVNIGAGVVRVTAPSAYLEIGPTSGGTKGLLGPRLTSTERDAISSPADGLLIYNTTTKKYQYYDGGASSWKDLGNGAGGGSGITQLGTSPWGLTKLNDSTYLVDSMKVLTKYQGEKIRDSISALINAKLNISDTANIRPRLYQGSNITITGTYPNLTIASTGGGAPSGNYGNVPVIRNAALATPASDSLNFSGGLAVKGSLSATALPTGGVDADSLVVINSSGSFKKRNVTAFPTGSGTNLQLALWNGTNSITGHQRYTWANSNDYPSLTIGAGSGATYGASLQLRDVAGTYMSITSDGGPMSLYGSSTYKSINFYDYAGGAGILGRFYSGSGTKYNELQGLVILSTLSVPSNEQGAITIARTAPYQVTGNPQHGFTDQTNFKTGNAAFNSFGSFVHFGNNTTNQDHYASFQTVYYKDSSNTMDKVYGFVNAVPTISGGLINNYYGYYHYSPSFTGGAITNQYGIYIPAVTGANRNLAAYFGDSIQIADGSQGAGKVLTSDANGQASWQTPNTSTTEGSYTPSLTNTTNIAASTAYTTFYAIINSTVHVWGTVDIDATSALSVCEMGLSLPVSSSLGNIYNLAGTAAYEDNTTVQIKADVANSRAVWRFTPQTATNNKYSFHFTYKYTAP